MSERKPLSVKIRFEVFKRDRFTCQYCGKSAPEIVLNCDHIKPVADGGENDPLNLITSCRACNSGKGATLLSDNAAIDRQRVMLVELEERRQQLEMMVAWRDGLASLKDDTLDLLSDACARGGFQPNDKGRESIRKWTVRYSTAELFRAIDESFDVYLADGDVESWRKAFSKIPVFADSARQEADRPYFKKLLYIQAILRNRTGHRGTLAYLEHLHLCGKTLDELEQEARRTDYITHFTKPYDEWLRSIGRPF